MTFITAHGSEALADQEGLRLGSFGSVLTVLLLRNLSFTATMKSLVQVSKTIGATYNASFQEARVRDVSSDLGLWGSLLCSVESSYRRYIRATKQVQRFPETLRLVRRTDDEAACRDSASAKSALSATHLDIAVLSRAEKHDVLLYIEAASAHIQGQKQTLTFSGCAFYSYAACHLRERKNVHPFTCGKHFSTRDEFLLCKVPHTNSSSLPVRIMYSNAKSLSSFDVAHKQKLFTTRAKPDNQRLVRAVPMHFAVGKE